MRIAIDTQSTLGRKTGIGIYTTKLLEALRQTAPQHEYVELDWGRAPVMRIDRRLFWQQWQVPRRARAAHADLLHVPGFDAPLRRPCLTILTVHDLIGMLFPHNLPPAARFYWAWWLPRSVRWADQIIADSENTKRDITRLLGIQAEHIEVIYLGVSSTFRPLLDQATREAVRHKHDLPPNFALYVGTLEPRKGLDTLVAAFGAIAANTACHLVIAGKLGWYTKPLFRQIETLGLSQRVHVIDYVADEDMASLYNLADLFVYPSRYEGFGLPPLEAMACGAPVIASDAASLPEVVGEAGRLIPPDDIEALASAMLQVLSDTTLQTRMRESGLARARRFTWEETARRTAQVYVRLQQGLTR